MHRTILKMSTEEEKHSIIPDKKCGFRVGHTKKDQVTKMTEDAMTNTEKPRKTLMENWRKLENQEKKCR